MGLTLADKIWLFACGAVLPYFVIGTLVALIRYTVSVPRRLFWPKFKQAHNALVFALGLTERGIGIGLLWFVPTYFPWFVGGWMTYKYAAGWYKNDEPNARVEILLALFGTALSFVFASIVGCFINPDAVTQLKSPRG